MGGGGGGGAVGVLLTSNMGGSPRCDSALTGYRQAGRAVGRFETKDRKKLEALRLVKRSKVCGWGGGGGSAKREQVNADARQARPSEATRGRRQYLACLSRTSYGVLSRYYSTRRVRSLVGRSFKWPASSLKESHPCDVGLAAYYSKVTK